MKECRETITVLNARLVETTGGNTWYSTVITGVHWYLKTGASAGNKGLTEASSVVIRIPTDADFSGKTYLPPKQYAAQADPAGFFTFAHGDLVVRGRVARDLLTPADLQRDFDESATILQTVDNTRAPNAPHWRVVAE